ncbi:hypothetical protein AB0940_30755 [Streptomyces sp. NPDC006656]
MVHLRERDGQPSLAELQRHVGKTPDGRRRLPKSSIGAVLRGDAVPTRGHVVVFAQALGMSRRKAAERGKAWDLIVGEAVADTPALPPNAPTGASAPARTCPAWSGRLNTYGAATTEEVNIVPVFSLNRLPRCLRGPLPPLPPKGRTGSGLPIRAPRRYLPPAPALRGLPLS